MSVKRKRGKRQIIRTVVARTKTEAKKKAQKVKKILEQKLNRIVRIISIND